MRSLSETFNVNYFLVSQTNPHIVPLMNLKKRVPRKLGNFVETEWKHRWACCVRAHCGLSLMSPQSHTPLTRHAGNGWRVAEFHSSQHAGLVQRGTIALSSLIYKQ